MQFKLTLTISVNEYFLLPIPMITLFKRRIANLNISTTFIVQVPNAKSSDLPSYHDFILSLIHRSRDYVLKGLGSGNVSYCYTL